MDSTQKYKLLSMMGYKGPKDESLMSSFISSNPAAEAKLGQFDRAITKKFSTGGLTTTDSTTTDYTDQLNTLYNDLLGRDIAEAGSSFYNPLLQSGQMTLDQVQADIQKNAAGEITVQNVFQNMLGRSASTADLAFYAPLLQSGQLTEADLRADIFKNTSAVTHNDDTPTADAFQTPTPTTNENSNTFVPVSPTTTTDPSAGPSQADNLSFLADGYRQIFDRNPDQEGLDFWFQKVDAGEMTAEEALGYMLVSEEAQLIQNGLFDEAKALRDNQANYLQSVYSNPSSLVTASNVAQIQPSADTMVDANVGQVNGQIGYTPSTITNVATADTPTDISTATAQTTTIQNQLESTLGDLEAQSATPSSLATVQGQLESLMADFEEGTPPWASEAMRTAMGVMQARGLGASSVAGQAIVQSAMESATAIAQQDANTYATFELQSLDNAQQTEIFKAQQRISGLFTDQAALNAASQFNASSENQTAQFMASLRDNASQFNAAQINAVSEINTNAENAASQFNATMTDLRDRFNAENSLIVAQANAQWRQNVNTLNTTEQNDANMAFASSANALTASALDQLWQRERDLMSFSFSSSESALERELSLLLADQQDALVKYQQDAAEDQAQGYVLANLASSVLFGGSGSGGFLGGLF